MAKRVFRSKRVRERLAARVVEPLGPVLPSVAARLGERSCSPQAVRLRPARLGATSSDAVLLDFGAHLRDVHGMTPGTCEEYCRMAQRLLKAKYGAEARDLAGLVPDDVARFVSDYAARVGPGTARQLATGLRAFLRWLQFRGFCNARLVAAIPAFRTGGWYRSEAADGRADPSPAGRVRSLHGCGPA